MTDRCCPAGFTGLRPLGDCSTYFNCVNGEPIGGDLQCVPGLLFDEGLQYCTWPDLLEECTSGPCIPTMPPTVTPTTATPTATPTMTPTDPAPSATPTMSVPPTNEPTISPTLAPLTCCPDGFSGGRALAGCTRYYTCVLGVVLDAPLADCSPGLLFDEAIQGCNWADDVTCIADPCVPTAAPTNAPTMEGFTRMPTQSPTTSSAPTTDFPSHAPSLPATLEPTYSTERCCPPDFTGSRAFDDCRQYYQCINGEVSGGLSSCTPGLLFDERIQTCNWADQVVECKVDPCAPTAAPTSSPTISPYPTRLPTISPRPTPLQSASPSDLPTVNPTAAPTSAKVMCCPPGFTGDRAFADCTKYYGCRNGELTGITSSCAPGLLFDETKQLCDWEANVDECKVDVCVPTTAPTRAPTHSPSTTPPTTSPTTSPPTLSPTSSPPTHSPTTGPPITGPPTQAPTPIPTTSPSQSKFPTIPPTPSPTSTPTIFVPRQCCPPGFSGQRAFDRCTKYYQCANGEIVGPTMPCGSGLLFDEAIGNCNWADQVDVCKVDVCVPTPAPTMAPTTLPPSSVPSFEPSARGSVLPTRTAVPTGDYSNAPSLSQLPGRIPQPTPIPTAAPAWPSVSNNDNNNNNNDRPYEAPTRPRTTRAPTTLDPTSRPTEGGSPTRQPVVEEADERPPVVPPTGPDFFNIPDSSSGSSMRSMTTTQGRILVLATVLLLLGY